MTSPVVPVPVLLDEKTIRNWAEAAKPPVIKNTTAKTYLLDAAGTPPIGQGRMAQICDYEPKRVRVVIKPIDQAVALTFEPPTSSPDTSSATVAPQGAHLAVTNDEGYKFFGPDAMWVNSITGTTRVTVIKEYC